MLHPPLTPRRTGWLEVGDGHRVYWEDSGAADGVPVVMLHGGPGGASGDVGRRWFNASSHRIVTYDQRGCGHSTPLASVTANTTAHLVRDIEHLRTHLQVDRWLICGGSWGATLALAYAQAHPARVRALLLHAVFTATEAELDWLYGGGASSCEPDAWAVFSRDSSSRRDILDRYAAMLSGADEAAREAAARAWCLWEDTLAAEDGARPPYDPRTARTRAMLGVHYARHAMCLREAELLDGAERLAGVPGVIVQGLDDRVTPPAAAQALHEAWPGSRLRLVEGGGHAATGSAMMRAVLDEADRLTAGLA